MNVFLGDKNLSEFGLHIKKVSECTLYAASELNAYYYKATGKAFKEGGKNKSGLIVIDYGDKFDDGFTIKAENGNLYLTGDNERSALYAVYELLERIGWRFFSCGSAYRMLEVGSYMFPCEALTCDKDEFFPENLYIRQRAAIAYRDGWSFATRDSEFCAKIRLNAATWGVREMGKKFGGERKFAHSAGHTFCELLPLSEYAESHPEYFAEINGKRVTESPGWNGEPQFCLTNFESADAVAERLIEWKAAEPDADYVSVSQNDNLLFCECENCKKAYKKHGRFGTLILYVNEVAERLERVYPELKIHTYAYMGTDDINDSVKAHKNVVIQWCPVTMCRNHALDDPSCRLNAKHLSALKTLAKVTDNVFVFDYRSCLKYAMLNFTDIFKLRETMRAYAENHVTGLYSELCLETLNEPTFEELRAYLFGKLLWNPYMSEEEYDGHINEFLKYFYGAGWRFIREYLERWCGVNPDMHYTSFYACMRDDEGRYIKDENGRHVFAAFTSYEKTEPFCRELGELLDKAKKDASPAQGTRIEMIRTGLIWYELFITMKERLKTADEKERKKLLAKNEDLCSRMREYQMKYTNGIGMKNITFMYDDFSIPVSEWNYTGNIAGENAE